MMNFPAIICNNLQSCYCLLLCFFIFLAQIWRSVWFWDVFGPEDEFEVTLLAEQTGTWDVFWFCLDMSQKLGTTALAKYLFSMTPNSQLLELMIFLRTKSWLLVGPWVLYHSVAQFCQNHMFCISNPQALKSRGWVADTNFAARARSHNGVDRGWVEQLNLLL